MKYKTLGTNIKHFNDWLATQGTKIFGTMIMTYIFIAYGLLPLFFPDQRDLLLYWSNVIQLVALPLLMVGQNLTNKLSERRAQKTYEMIKDELKIMEDVIKKIDPDYVLTVKNRRKTR